MTANVNINDNNVIAREIIARYLNGADGKSGPLTDHTLTCADTILEELAQAGYVLRKKKYWTAELRNEASKQSAKSYRGNQYTKSST